jgi:mannose-6-phosphate isomerase-like protein (cupin superfamily)
MITDDGCVVMQLAEGTPVAGAAGAPTLVKARAEATGGLLEVFEQVAAVGSGPPQHIHHECAESLLVIEGDLRFALGAQTADVSAGGFVFVPKGVPHTYTNISRTEGRIVFWFTPAGRMADYFAELAATKDLDERKLDDIAQRHGVEIMR